MMIRWLGLGMRFVAVEKEALMATVGCWRCARGVRGYEREVPEARGTYLRRGRCTGGVGDVPEAWEMYWRHGRV
jgi:hypothetical protein